MIIINKKDLATRKGRFLCLYSRPKVGKTVSTLQSAIDPILWFTTEPRYFQASIDAADRPSLKITTAIHEGYVDTIGFFHNPDKALDKANSEYDMSEFATIFMDGMSYFQNIIMPGEIQQEDFAGETDNAKKTIKRLTKITQPQQGQGNQAIFRVMKLLADYVARNKTVIVSCLEMDRPKYDREFEAGPSLSGKQVPDNFSGFFDLIGRVFSRLEFSELYGEESLPKGWDSKHYPPWISFDETRGFLAGYTGGKGKKEGPLHWGKILGNIEGKEKND